MKSNWAQEVLTLLIDTGVFTFADVKSIQHVHGEAILDMMLERRVIPISEIENAKGILLELSHSSNHIKRVQAQSRFVELITANIHRRMHAASDELVEQHRKITADEYPAVAALPLKSGK